MVRIPGSHPPNIKNRSSKQNIWFTKMKPSVRSLSNEALQKLSSESEAAAKELKRRANKKNKR